MKRLGIESMAGVMADLYEVLDGEWRTTQALAQRAGYEWRPGANWPNSAARSALFGLLMNARDVEHQARQNGHLWRRV